MLHRRFNSRIRTQYLTLVIIGMMFMFQRPVFADSVYRLNNYPSKQDAGTLTGSITVLDSAADDGVLVEAEIVEWNFVATNTNPAFQFLSPIAGSSVDALLGSRVQASNISIDDRSITIGSVDGLDRRLSLIEFSGGDGVQGRLTWHRTPDRNDYFVHVTEHCVANHDPLISPCSEDFHERLWQTSPASLGGDPWVIATRVSHLSDLTGNGFVDFEDLTLLLANWNKEVTAAEGNLVNADTTPVNFEDLTVLLADWTGPGPAASPAGALGAEAVPEPSSLLLALLATLGLSFYRRRRQRAF